MNIKVTAFIVSEKYINIQSTECTDDSKMHNNRIILFFIETGKLGDILYCSQ